MARQLKRLSEFVPQGSTVGLPLGSKNQRLQVIPQAELAAQFAQSGLLATPAQVNAAVVLGIPAAAIFVPATGLALLTSGVVASVCSFLLPAGAWDISGSITFNPNGAAASSFTDAQVGISTSPSIMPTGPNGGGYVESTSSMSIAGPTTLATAVMRVMPPAPTTYYLLAKVVYS